MMAICIATGIGFLRSSATLFKIGSGSKLYKCSFSKAGSAYSEKLHV